MLDSTNSDLSKQMHSIVYDQFSHIVDSTHLTRNETPDGFSDGFLIIKREEKFLICEYPEVESSATRFVCQMHQRIAGY